LERGTCRRDGAFIAPREIAGEVENLSFSPSSNAGARLNLNVVAANPIDGVHLTNCTTGGNVQDGIWVNSNSENIDTDNVTTVGDSQSVNNFPVGRPALPYSRANCR
jgi:hypothetical protein